MAYHWQWIPSEKDENEDWQPCDEKWSSGATLSIPNVQKFNEGIYRCVVSNRVGNVTSNPATLEVNYIAIIYSNIVLHECRLLNELKICMAQNFHICIFSAVLCSCCMYIE